VADADGWESPEQKERILALARRLKQATQATIEHDARLMMAQQVKWIGSMDLPPPRKRSWRERLVERVNVARERLALWLAPWLERDSMDD